MKISVSKNIPKFACLLNFLFAAADHPWKCNCSAPISNSGRMLSVLSSEFWRQFSLIFIIFVCMLLQSGKHCLPFNAGIKPLSYSYSLLLFLRQPNVDALLGSETNK